MTRKPGRTGDNSAKGRGKGKGDDRTVGFRKYQGGMAALEALISLTQKRTDFGNRKQVGTNGSLAGKEKVGLKNEGRTMRNGVGRQGEGSSRGGTGDG